MKHGKRKGIHGVNASREILSSWSMTISNEILTSVGTESRPNDYVVERQDVDETVSSTYG